ncbi:DNA/RNA helicase domain-containing protein, partial [Streptomyces sp. NPDC058254]|uniref:DNA/RNA helicase domain-containing protein n=1 Tax=Streptomyces sp. NPDC058254 TaxID=3346406 RepID=UPI0036E7F033
NSTHNSSGTSRSTRSAMHCSTNNQAIRNDVLVVPTLLWAADLAGFGQVGWVYTAQGFEYDWSGVIIGPDLVWRGDHWVTDRTASKDPVFRKATSDADVDRLIRNTYKVLLTRGMVGTVVYSTDSETREKLRELVGAERAVAPAVV